MLAFIVEQTTDPNQPQRATLRQVDESQLPAGNVTVAVAFSSLNYKDALAITGRGKILRQLPMIPGIDLAGHVLHSADPRFRVNQPVLLTGHGVGEKQWGGLAQLARVNGDWLLPIPDGLDARHAMIIGTAGLTAMLCVMALEQAGLAPQQGEVLVTGASGGVGSTAIALLHQLGYQVVAVSGRQSRHDDLRQLGASQVLPRQQFTDARPLESQRWAGAIDTLGGGVLSKVLAQTRVGGCVAACGMASSADLHTSVMPFILRNVRLQGVNAATPDRSLYEQAWQRLAQQLPASYFRQVAKEIPLSEVARAAQALIDNQAQGRTLVRIES